MALSVATIKMKMIEVWQHAGFQKYFLNTGWMFIARVFMLAVAFFVNVYIARYLGPSNYGLLSYVFSFVGLFAFLSSFGIESIASREIIKNHSEKDKIVGTSFFLKLGGSFLATGVVALVSFLTTHDAFLFSLISLYALTFLFTAFNIVEVYFQSQVLSKYPAIVTIVSGIVSAIMKIVVIIMGKGIVWLAAIYMLESVLISVGLLYYFVQHGHSLRTWVFDKELAVSMLRDSWPLMFSFLAFGVYMKTDQVMLKHMLGNESVGIYAVAAKLSEFWYFIPSIICASLFPAIMNAKKISKELFEHRLKKLYSLMFWISFGVATLVTLFGHQLILIIFGNQYLGALTVLRIYVWAGIGVSVGYVIYYYLLAENLTKINAFSMVFGAVTNVVLNFLLIPRYGISGAAFASFISYTVITLVSLLFKSTRSQIGLILKAVTSVSL